ncbi:MAG: hypothetical protein R6U98_29640 [Pirellulaceae bacterium]
MARQEFDESWRLGLGGGAPLQQGIGEWRTGDWQQCGATTAESLLDGQNIRSY